VEAVAAVVLEGLAAAASAAAARAATGKF